jgi:hypothetical protein
MVLLEDCCSSVAGFEEAGEQFKKELLERGGRITTTEEWLKRKEK